MEFYELKTTLGVGSPAELMDEKEYIETFSFDRGNSVYFDTGLQQFSFFNVINIDIDLDQREYFRSDNQQHLQFVPARQDITITITMPPSDMVERMLSHINETQRRFNMSMPRADTSIYAYGCWLLYYIRTPETDVVLTIKPDYIEQEN